MPITKPNSMAETVVAWTNGNWYGKKMSAAIAAAPEAKVITRAPRSVLFCPKILRDLHVRLASSGIRSAGKKFFATTTD